MNSENSKTSEYHVLVLQLTDKLEEVKNTVKVLIIHQLEYMQIELKIELRLKFKVDIILNF